MTFLGTIENHYYDLKTLLVFQGFEGNFGKIFEIFGSILETVFGSIFGLIFLTTCGTIFGTMINWMQENMWDNIWCDQMNIQADIL